MKTKSNCNQQQNTKYEILNLSFQKISKSKDERSSHQIKNINRKIKQISYKKKQYYQQQRHSYCQFRNPSFPQKKIIRKNSFQASQMRLLTTVDGVQKQQFGQMNKQISYNNPNIVTFCQKQSECPKKFNYRLFLQKQNNSLGIRKNLLNKYDKNRLIRKTYDIQSLFTKQKWKEYSMNQQKICLLLGTQKNICKQSNLKNDLQLNQSHQKVKAKNIQQKIRKSYKKIQQISAWKISQKGSLPYFSDQVNF